MDLQKNCNLKLANFLVIGRVGFALSVYITIQNFVEIS